MPWRCRVSLRTKPAGPPTLRDTTTLPPRIVKGNVVFQENNGQESRGFLNRLLITSRQCQDGDYSMREDLFDLTQKVAAVTGAARGLGRAVAAGLARYGAEVAVVDLDRDRCAATVQEITALQRRAVAYGCDVADESAVCTTVEQIHRDFGRVDILVNIAGITARIPTEEMPPETVRRLTEVNYYGTFWMCQAVGKMMLAQGRGNIINMSALGGGLVGMGRGNAAYCSTKGAIAALTTRTGLRMGRSRHPRQCGRPLLVSDRHECDQHLRQRTVHGTGDDEAAHEAHRQTAGACRARSYSSPARRHR